MRGSLVSSYGPGASNNERIGYTTSVAFGWRRDCEHPASLRTWKLKALLVCHFGYLVDVMLNPAEDRNLGVNKFEVMLCFKQRVFLQGEIYAFILLILNQTQ